MVMKREFFEFFIALGLPRTDFTLIKVAVGVSEYSLIILKIQDFTATSDFPCNNISFPLLKTPVDCVKSQEQTQAENAEPETAIPAEAGIQHVVDSCRKHFSISIFPVAQTNDLPR